MILLDTSVWVGHLRNGDAGVESLLNSGQVLCHSVVIGELALGNLANRARLLGLLKALPAAVEASHAEVMALVERRRLWGLGIGYGDAQLLAATHLTPDARLWTRDRRLGEVARDQGIAAFSDG
ncbi:type II toxin-antitoxin system VapC family toxin [Caulobacter sp. NIBR1757]|uniref:type II toxin-antitoxin system VapC family toxin n=1 Tax=Caulobacter sp. NIBR1757 TaxID=3016000 RepID=UPI0022F019AC|nr:type II toxin-antitoxin system VapC family toxin [Caulobacter sp. NIBR1757]WGM40128.1 Ribonuclease VapC32 [Caulobacter sp. NIBR1757]